MKISKILGLSTVAVATLICATNPQGASANTVAAAPPATINSQSIPIEAWALRGSVNAVDLSPDGKHLLVQKLETKDGQYVLEIYKTDDLTTPLRRLNANPMEILEVKWVSNNFIYGTAWQVNRKTVTGPEADVRDYKSFSYDLAKNKFNDIEGNYYIVNDLPKEPDHVLIAAGDGGKIGGINPNAIFRPQSYYRFNLKTGAKTLVLNGSIKYSSAEFDDEGNPRYAQGYDVGSNEVIQYYRKPGDKSWKEFMRLDQDDPKNLYRFIGGASKVVGFDKDDPNIGYIIDNNGEDKAALWEFNFSTGKFGEKIYQNPDADVIDVVKHSMRNAGNNNIVAAMFPGAKYQMAWFDEEEKALYDALEKQIPNAYQVAINSRSEDGKTMVVYNTGPHDPGSFWLVSGGKLIKMGSTNPYLTADKLSDVEFIKYPARDGRIIPAYLTKPKGKGPFPLVVLPHGGPHMNEVVLFEEWAQLLANNGYMVLQPQYRMSVGWGQSHFDAGYGQHGLAMQDDKDDGAMYLVNKGLADKDRMAMFGWSYGGYAALVATTRSPNLYQCAIAGAATADPEKSYIAERSSDTPKPFDEWAKRRGTIGINPIKEVAKPSIPLLMVHGDVDRRVEYWNFKDYKKAADAAGKTNIQYLTLKGADHFYNTLMYNHKLEFYTKLIDYLKKDCGPGGL